MFIKFDLYLQKAKRAHIARAAQARPPPRSDIVRKSFRDVMGFGDAPQAAGKGGERGDNTVLIAAGMIGLGVVVIVVFLVLALSSD